MNKQINKNELWTSANIVTMIRILLVPVFVVALISPWPSWIDNSGSLDFIKPWVALVVFLVLSFTDSVDGYLARKKNEITTFGKFMDPLADKILVFAALLALIELHVLPSWVVLIILIREFIVAGLRMLAASKNMVIAASWYGKAKTVAQLVAIALFILKESLSSSGAQDIANPIYICAWVVMIIALVLTIVSMIDYIYNAREIFMTKENPTEDLASQVIKLANEKGVTIGTAESLTGGLVASKLTSVSGSSKVYAGSVVSYMYKVKEKLLGIDPVHLKNYGAVNETTAIGMATGAVEKLNCDLCVSTTGIAGPDKDEFDTPVGEVFIGFANKKDAKAKRYKFKGSRKDIREACVEKALSVFIILLKDLPNKD